MGSPQPDRATRGKQVLAPDDIARSLTRIAYEIIERNDGADGLVIAGIPTRGATLARRLVERIAQVGGPRTQYASIDTTMFRDDLRAQPLRPPHRTEIPESGIDGRPVVLVDRGHRELPIRPDYVGKNLPTSRSETVTILLDETDGADAVLLGVR